MLGMTNKKIGLALLNNGPFVHGTIRLCFFPFEWKPGLRLEQLCEMTHYLFECQRRMRPQASFYSVRHAYMFTSQ